MHWYHHFLPGAVWQVPPLPMVMLRQSSCDQGEPMKIAVLSDVHGFSLALDRVLADIATEPGIDTIVVAGDLVQGGPDPAGALARLRESGAILLQGNTDRNYAEQPYGSKSHEYLASHLSESDREFLENLQFSSRISPPGGNPPDDDLLVVHANPQDLDRKFIPFSPVSHVTDLIGDTRAAVIAFGHHHIAYMREVDGLLLVDVSATGNPKDGDLRSKWGMFTWNESAKKWTAELRYVAYPLEETIAQFHQMHYPDAEAAIARLKWASYID
jgi:predicted phosphodiesterase